MSITVSGLSSGIDYDSLVTKLMAVEGEPLTALKAKVTTEKAKLTAMGTVKSALSTFQTTMLGLSYPTTYQNLKASVADTSVATASASSIANSGTYSLEVSKLAQAQKLVATGMSSASAAIGNGVLSFDFGTISGGTFDEQTGTYSGATFTSAGADIKTVTIDGTNNSLSGIRDAINSANIGITATIVNDGSGTPYRLALTAQNSGAGNSIKISVAGDSALSALMSHDPEGVQKFQENAAAQNAALKVDGISITKSSNTVGDVIPGVTLNLLKTNTGNPSTVSVTREMSNLATAVQSFVTAYNDVNTALQELVAYNPTTKEGAILNGESTIRNIQTQLRKILSSPVTGSAGAFTLLSQVGVSFQKDGSLSLDSAKLQTAMANNPDAFAALFASAGKATDSLNPYVSATGNSKPGTYTVEISQLATQGKVVGSTAASLSITGSNNILGLSLNGIGGTITLDQKTYGSAADLAAAIQSKINSAAVFVAYGASAKVTAAPDGTLTITSNRYGSSSGATITGGNGRESLGMGSSATVSRGVNVAGKINGITATGDGQLLSGAAEDDSEGISINVTGGSIGMRGTVSYSQGYAHQFNTLLTTILGNDGSIATRISGMNTKLADMSKQESTLNARLAVIEARYRAQFTALETLLSNMNSTSTYLTQQFEALASLRNQRN